MGTRLQKTENEHPRRHADSGLLKVAADGRVRHHRTGHAAYAGVSIGLPVEERDPRAEEVRPERHGRREVRRVRGRQPENRPADRERVLAGRGGPGQVRHRRSEGEGEARKDRYLREFKEVLR